MKPETVKHTLFTLISQTCESRQFLKNPKKDFTRNRKLPLQQVFKLILGMGGGTLNHELLDYFAFSPETVTSSAFIQQRAKIMPEAFEHIFHQFARQNDGDKRYRGYRLLAFDGSDLLTRKQTNYTKHLFKNRNQYKCIPASAVFDYLPAKQRNVPLSFYSIAFRVVRFRLSDDSFETLLTNLDSDEFPSCELKKLYFRRWDIETSFRDLKYTIGLLHFHSKKTEHVL